MSKLPHSELRSRFRERFGRGLWLRGGSPALAGLLDSLTECASVRLPVLVFGERGAGREDAARILHLLGRRPGSPFIKMDVSVLRECDFQDEIIGAAQSVDGGTLFLACVDQMPGLLQSRLADMLKAGLPQWASSRNRDAASDVRFVAAALAQEAKSDRTATHQLHPALRDELAFLTFEVAPLRGRPEDIPALVRHFLRGFSSDPPQLSPEVEAALISHDWPGNIFELRRVAARLAAFGKGRILTMTDLTSHAPLPAPSGDAVVPGSAANGDQSRRGGACFSATPSPARLHPCVKRAVDYLRENFADEISLGALARRVRVSPSHLSHLFKRELQMSPMAFLARVRIEQAKTMLAADADSTVTEVAGRVGFGDLRHFERIFKRHVGFTPRTFRSRIETPSNGSHSLLRFDA